MPDELDALIRRAVAGGREKSAQKKRVVLQPAPGYTPGYTKPLSEPSITPGACWGKLTSNLQPFSRFDPKAQLGVGCGVEPGTYDVEKIDVTGCATPVVSSHARPLVQPFAQRSFPYYLEKASLPNTKELTGAAARLNSRSHRLYSLGGDVPFPDAFAKFHPAEPVYPSRFAKRSAEAAASKRGGGMRSVTGAASAPSLNEYSIWGDGSPDDSVAEAGAGRGEREREKRAGRKANFHSEVGVQGDPSSIIYGRPNLLLSALESPDDKPFRAEMPRPTPEEEEEKAPKASPGKIKEVENEIVRGRDRWLPWNYDQLVRGGPLFETREEEKDEEEEN